MELSKVYSFYQALSHNIEILHVLLLNCHGLRQLLRELHIP